MPLMTLNCKNCGAPLPITEGKSTSVCEHCDSPNTLPKFSDDRKTNLYERASGLLRNKEFDKAMGLYEEILRDDISDAEIYWSIVCCRFGVEYVKDPATGRGIPTINRAQYTSIFDDEDYKQAIKYADEDQKSVYEEEAKIINEIQKGFLKISQSEDPFDIFICYKETDENGRRTLDSVLATDLYEYLTREGFKVFFARITLEDKLGSAYEPYIFAALNSAKVMVVLGTKPEYFNAVWVKNEWSRYLALIRQGEKKSLVPAYKDMDPRNLPEEFSHLQAQDMSKLGYMQDLVRGIRKIGEFDKPKEETIKTVTYKYGGDAAPTSQTEALLKRVFIFLEDGDWSNANTYCEKVLDIDPENAMAYMGKLMVQLKVRREEGLSHYSANYDTNLNFQKAMRYASPQLKSRLNSYADQTRKNLREAYLAAAYSKAIRAMKCAENLGEYREAAELFKGIAQYMDSAKLAEECIRLGIEKTYQDGVRIMNDAETESDFVNAATYFYNIPDYKDATELRIECLDLAKKAKELEAIKAAAAREERMRREEAEREEYIRQEKERRRAETIEEITEGAKSFFRGILGWILLSQVVFVLLGGIIMTVMTLSADTLTSDGPLYLVALALWAYVMIISVVGRSVHEPFWYGLIIFVSRIICILGFVLGVIGLPVAFVSGAGYMAESLCADFLVLAGAFSALIIWRTDDFDEPCNVFENIKSNNVIIPLIGFAACSVLTLILGMIAK